MTALNPLAQANQAIQQRNGDQNQKLQAAARQFEGVLMTQLLQVLWKTTPQLNKGQGSMYQSMFQSSFADHLVEGGGIGLASMIAKALGAEDEPGAGATRHLQSATNPLPQPVAPPPAAAHPAHPAHQGVLGDVALAAQGMIEQGADHWGKDGSLTPEDYGSLRAGQLAGDSARRSVVSANGYRGYYKCNLFAFEVARRAGLSVPQNQRTGAVLLSSSNRLTQDASDGSLETGWATVATGASPAAMQDALRAGEAAFLLVGSGRGDRHGHMAVIEQPTAIDYDDAGQIRSISFQGWEAQPDGAKHLLNRTWNRFGEKGARNDRNGLERIEIIQLSRKDPQPHARTKTPLQSP